MVEKIKSKVLTYTIVSLIIILIVIVGVVLYRKISSDSKNEGKLNEQNQYEEVKTSEEEYVLHNETKNKAEENTNDIEEYDKTENINFNLNNEEIKIMFSYNNLEKICDEDDLTLYRQKYTLTIDDKNIEGIEFGSKWMSKENEIQGELYNINKFKDKITNKEYLILQVYEDFIANGPSINVYIIDCSNGKMILKFKNDINVSQLYLKDKLEIDEEGSYIISEEAELKMRILEESIISFEYNKETDKYDEITYTINNGVVEEVVNNSYDKTDIYTVGK